MVHSFMLSTLLLSFSLLSAATPIQIEARNPVAHYKPSRYMSGLPQNATHLSFDTETGELTAYDITHRVLAKQKHSPANSTTHATRQTVGSCAAMVNGDVQKLPGYNALLADANSLLGKHSWTNLGQYLLPISTTRIPTYTNLQPTTTATRNTPRAFALTLTRSWIPDLRHPKREYQWRPSRHHRLGNALLDAGNRLFRYQHQSSALAIGASFSVKVSFPGEEYSSTFSVTSTYTNTLSTATQTTDNQQSTESITMAAPAGESCSLEYTTKSCSVTGTGTIRAAATGWAWFEYNSGKTHWALNMDYFLTLDQRSSFIDFRSGITSSTLSSYTGKCA
ncbi:hypothetical protein C8R44DRAFT_877693 [Mycena epipterygia]|nr:hypothetical protein C8R44DRAFT_877693 [Mycena epipterygia]